jgi:hypothetical protein
MRESIRSIVSIIMKKTVGVARERVETVVQMEIADLVEAGSGADRKEPAAQNDRRRYMASGAIELRKAWAAWGELAKKAHRSEVGRPQEAMVCPTRTLQALAVGYTPVRRAKVENSESGDHGSRRESADASAANAH